MVEKHVPCSKGLGGFLLSSIDPFLPFEITEARLADLALGGGRHASQL